MRINDNKTAWKSKSCEKTISLGIVGITTEGSWWPQFQYSFVLSSFPQA